MREIADSLVRMGLAGAGEDVSIRALSGGVSCDTYEVHVAGRALCVKRALPKLRVKADWFASARRSEAEAAWMRLAGSVVPGHVPAVLGEDAAHHVFAMQFFAPAEHPVWKARLAGGAADAAFAAEVGRLLARIHAATTGRADVARDFSNGDQFRALRVDAYLLYTADRHPCVAAAIRAMAASLETARIALMHGDVSPKNILCGPDGPVFLDAETCCYGDPAFDLAFCLNHLLLKAVWHREFAAPYAASFARLYRAYLAGIDWEPPADLARRAAGFLAAFLLARIDGKSPVEYLCAEADKDFVRTMALRFLTRPADDPAAMAQVWFAAVSP
jgi:aminoglycoside phosphotransferase (APT) family kinase protein